MKAFSALLNMHAPLTCKLGVYSRCICTNGYLLFCSVSDPKVSSAMLQ